MTTPRPAAPGEPRETEAGKRLVRELRIGGPSENWLSIASWVEAALPDIESEASDHGYAVGRANADEIYAATEAAAGATAEAARSERERVRAALERYGMHENECHYIVGTDCDCGFRAALESQP